MGYLRTYELEIDTSRLFCFFREHAIGKQLFNVIPYLERYFSLSASHMTGLMKMKKDFP